ncbi:DsrE/DsrF/DrsH-like family protein, partial [Prosthecochloris sp.]
MAETTKKVALIASRGTLDWAYPPFILGSAAAA